jgi:MYXO-CTERM domain-containing protein
VSNIHTAERIIECNPDIFQSEAPWRIEFPQGGVVRGTASQVGSWPDFTDQPANLRILQQGESGDGRILEDNSGTIEEMLDAYNETIPSPTGTGGSTGSGGTLGFGGSMGWGGVNSSDGSGKGSDSGGCNMRGGTGSGAPWVLLALALLARRRRHQTSA